MSYAAQALHVDLIAAGAIALALIALALLWRQRHQRRALRAARAMLAAAQRAQAAAELALTEHRARVCQLMAQQDSVREHERQRIARDIHDDLGQNLLALTMDIAALASAEPNLRASLQQLDEHISASIRSLRAIIRDLRPEALEHGLRGAVERQVTLFSRLSGIECRLQADLQAYSAAPDPKVDAALYRILQESLSNIARHAQATRVDIALCRQPHSLTLTVCDNGVGLPAAPTRGGWGLPGIEERVTRAGGTFHVASRPGKGTALSISFPLQLVPCQAETVEGEAK